jgi:cold shock CspA family protein/ribosome-associated translation inhibitor RaiA
MILPLQITFRHMNPSPAMEARIRALAARFDNLGNDITRCHVIVERPEQHKHHGGLFDVTIDMTLGDAEIAIRGTHPADHSHEDPYLALHDAFRAARRKLEDYQRKRHHDVKTHEGPAPGRISELDAEHDSGRIESADGRSIYFHRNSVLGGRFKDLRTGTEVRFSEEPGDQGPQASMVHVMP